MRIGLAVARADHVTRVGAAAADAAGHGQQVGQAHVGHLDRVAPGRLTWPSTLTWLPRTCITRMRHLRLLDEVAVAQAVGDQLLGLRSRSGRRGARCPAADS